MRGKVCLITGGTGGIGRQTGLELAKQGAMVVLAGRSAERGAEAVAAIRKQSGNADVAFLQGDLSLQADVRALAAEFERRYDRLDALINNAGVVKKQRELTADGLETTFAVNHLAPFLLTHLLRDILKASGRAESPSRILNVSSAAHKVLWKGLDFDNLQGEKRFRSFPIYGASKLANVLFTHALAKRLQGTNITAYVLHPGVINTDISRENDTSFVRLAYRVWGRSPEEGARTPVYLATSAEVIPLTGMYFEDCHAAPSSRASYNRDAEERLWDISEQLTQCRSF